jgi:hypothetical protein
LIAGRSWVELGNWKIENGKWENRWFGVSNITSRIWIFQFPSSSFHFPILALVQEKQLKHEAPCPDDNGSVSQIEGVPVIRSVVNVDKIHNSAESDTVEEI